MRADCHAAFRKLLLCQRTGKHKRRGYTPRKVTAAAKVAVFSVFDKRCVVRVSRSYQVFFVIGRTCVAVFYYSANRRPCRVAVKHARNNLYTVLFVPFCRKSVSTRSAAQHFPRNKLRVNLHSRPYSVHCRAYCRAVGFAENRYLYFIAPYVHLTFPPSAL